MFKELINNVSNKYKKIQEESLAYNELLKTTQVVSNLENIPTINKKDITISYKDILEICPDLNDKKAMIIRGILPLGEIYLTVMYAKECKTSKEYFLVPSNECLWIISVNDYCKYSYDDLKVEVVKNNVMSKVLNLSNILFEVNGLEQKINDFMRIINDRDYRENLSTEKLKMFCGITPKLCLINDVGTGISMDNEKNFVFHTKEFNYKYNINDIKNYELMLDDNVVLEKRSNRRVRMTASKSSCYQMNIRVTTTDKTFILPIIIKGAFAEVYHSTNEVYINSRNFAEKIISLLDEANEDMLNGV